MDAAANRQKAPDFGAADVIRIRWRLSFPSLLSLITYILTATAISLVLLSASRIIDAAQVFLFTSPASAGASARIAAAASNAVFTWLRATTVFVLALLAGLATNRTYMKANVRGIALTSGAYACWLFGALGLVFWVKLRDTPRVPFAYPIIGALVGFASIQKGSRIFATARQQMLRSADDVLARVSRPPIVYLRSFAADTQDAPEYYALQRRENRLTWRVVNPAFWIERRDWTFEEVLCVGLSAVSPVVAIGQPNEKLPRLGAARKYTSDVEWEQEVIRLLRLCRFVCLVIGTSRGLMWELRQALSRCLPQQVLLVVPPGAGGRAAWSEFAEWATAEAVAITLPRELPDNALGMIFTDRWKPIIVTGQPRVGGYRELARIVVTARR